MIRSPGFASGGDGAAVLLFAPNLELEKLHGLAAAVFAELADEVEDLHVLSAERSSRLVGGLLLIEEVVEGDIEDGEDLEEVVQRDPVLTLLHPRQVGLLDANLACQLGLCEMAFLPQRAQTGTHVRRGRRQFMKVVAISVAVPSPSIVPSRAQRTHCTQDDIYSMCPPHARQAALEVSDCTQTPRRLKTDTTAGDQCPVTFSPPHDCCGRWSLTAFSSPNWRGRAFASRHAGSLLGWLWTPLGTAVQFVLYTVVFSVILEIKIPLSWYRSC